VSREAILQRNMGRFGAQMSRIHRDWVSGFEQLWLCSVMVAPQSKSREPKCD
jgi:hypothetical protein